MSSRVFNARTASGACYFCRLAFRVGDPAFYMTAFASGEAPERPLTPAELATWRSLGRTRRAARTRRERQAIVSPAWLWDRMVHPDCAGAAGFPVPGAETTAQRGTRVIGHVHGTTAVGASESTPAPAVSTREAAREAAPAGFAGIVAETAGTAQAAREAARRIVPSWVASMAATPEATREREAAIAAREAARLARTAPAVSTPAPAPEPTPAPGEYAPGGPRPEGLSRMAHVLLDVFEGEAARPFEPRPETGPVVRALDLD